VTTNPLYLALRGTYAPGDARAPIVPHLAPAGVAQAVPVPPAGTAPSHIDTPLKAYAAVVLAAHTMYGPAATGILAQAACYFGEVAA
jgi:hypothetical protein